jgi:hypothetical protein
MTSFTILGRNFYDMDLGKTITDVYLGDYGVYFGQQGGGLWKDILLNKSRHKTEQIDNMPGLLFQGMTPTERKIQWPLYCENITESQLRDIQEILMVDTPLRFVTDQAPYKYIYAVVDDQIDFNYIRANNYSGTFVLSLAAYDPYWYSFYTSLEEMDLEYDDTRLYYDSGLLYSEAMTNATPVITQTTGSFQLYNAGNAYANIKIRLTNNGASTLSNIVLTNTTNNESFTISSLAAGSSVIVHGYKGLILNVAETSLLTSIFTGKFIRLKPKYNAFTVSLSGSGVNLAFSFDYKHTYL